MDSDNDDDCVSVEIQPPYYKKDDYNSSDEDEEGGFPSHSNSQVSYSSNVFLTRSSNGSSNTCDRSKSSSTSGRNDNRRSSKGTSSGYNSEKCCDKYMPESSLYLTQNVISPYSVAGSPYSIMNSPLTSTITTHNKNHSTTTSSSIFSTQHKSISNNSSSNNSLSSQEILDKRLKTMADRNRAGRKKGTTRAVVRKKGKTVEDAKYKIAVRYQHEINHSPMATKLYKKDLFAKICEEERKNYNLPSNFHYPYKTVLSRIRRSNLNADGMYCPSIQVDCMEAQE